MVVATHTVYDKLNAIGAVIDHWQSDLYTPYTPEALAIIHECGARHSFFKCSISGNCWIEVAFAYLPYFDSKKTKSERELLLT